MGNSEMHKGLLRMAGEQILNFHGTTRKSSGTGAVISMDFPVTGWENSS